MEIKVGDYARTKNGLITIIKTIWEQKWEEPECVYARVLCEDNEIYEFPKHIKTSPNIIDLIEVGDYVNGYKVISLWKDKTKIIGVAVDGSVIGFYECEIKSIVTKEQFESMEYKVND